MLTLRNGSEEYYVGSPLEFMGEDGSINNFLWKYSF